MSTEPSAKLPPAFLSLSLGSFFFFQSRTQMSFKNKIPLLDLSIPSNPFPREFLSASSTLVTNFILNHLKFDVIEISVSTRLKGTIVHWLCLKFLYNKEVKQACILSLKISVGWGTYYLERKCSSSPDNSISSSFMDLKICFPIVCIHWSRFKPQDSIWFNSVPDDFFSAIK